MFLKRGYLLWTAIGMAGWGALAQAGDFAPPAEGPVAFRRDRIPLDPDAISSLSRHLETLARGLTAANAADRRGAAQLLALALALDPANSKARELIGEFEAGDRKADADPVLLEKGRARIWQLLGWLDSPEAGSQGQALAACLKDVIVVSDPGNPKSAGLKQAGEKGAWAGWIPALSAYETPVIAENPQSGNPVDSLKPSVPSDAASALKLNKAQASTLLWRNVGKSDSPVWKLGVGQIEMAAGKSSQEGGDSGSGKDLVVRFGQGGENNPLNPIAGSLHSLLQKRHAGKAQGVTITIDSPDLQTALQANKRVSISAASAVLADSAFTGAEPDAIIIGSVDENGALKLPTGFWDMIRALPKGTGQRLVLPAEAATYMSSMLALEKPEFFMEYNVILASDFDQLTAYSAKTPEGQPGNAISEFRTIQDRLGSQDVRQYIANSFVKQRLYTVIQDLPADFSAKMLIIQAAGNRPTTVTRAVLASEIRRGLEPMAGLLKYQNNEFQASDVGKLGPAYEACRAGVDPLDRYAAKNDASLLAEARDMLNLIRLLEKATRTRAEDQFVKMAIKNAYDDLVRVAKKYSDKLAAEIGDPPPQGSR